MVAEMTSFGSSTSFEESERDISPPEQKGNVSENESSSSESTETSTGESSEDEGSDGNAAAEDDEEEEKDAIEGGASGHDQDPVPEPDSEEQSGTDAVRRVCCERCQLMQSQDQGFEPVNPRRISRGRLLALLDAEGVYECSVTGLVFEVTEKAQVRYSVLSWSKFGAYLQDSWKFAGPIFDVDCDPAILTAIQLPHSLCLADQADAVSFSVLHVKGGRGLVEAVSDHSGGRVKWRVSSLSPVGAIVQTPRPVEHHGVVLVFRELAQRSSNSFHVYIATNNESDIKDIKKEVRVAKKRFVMLDKPATCLLREESKYQLTSDPEGDITPECLRFTQAVLKMKSYFEVFFEQPPPFKLSLVEAESGQTVWSTTLREGDFEDMNANEKPKRRPEGGRKRSSSSSGEEALARKRARHRDVSDGARKTPVVTDEQLMKVAMRMGKEWKQVGILHLGMSAQDVDETQAGEEEPTMRRFRMLTLWRSREQAGATLPRLRDRLLHDHVPHEVRDLLHEMLPDLAAE